MNRKRWHVLSELASKFNLKKFAEVGVKSGRNIRELCIMVPDSTFIAVDPWVPTEHYSHWTEGQIRKNEASFDRVQSKWPHRIKKFKMFSHEAAELVKDGTLDCVFIDGDHSYEGVRLDIDCWLPKVRPGGIISGHDFDNTVKYGDKFKGVDRAVEETFNDFHLGEDHTWWSKV